MSNLSELDLTNESIATIFATCVSYFDYALKGRPNNRGFLRLSIMRLRLTRWGEAVNIFHDPELEDTTNRACIEKAKVILTKLVGHFEELSIVTNNETNHSNFNQAKGPNTILPTLLPPFRVVGDQTEKLAVQSKGSHSFLKEPENLEPVLPILAKHLKNIAHKRRSQQHPSLLKPQVLLLSDEVEKLIGSASECAGELERTIWPKRPGSLRSLSQKEKADINAPDVIRALEEIARDIDHWLRPCIEANVFGTTEMFAAPMTCGSTQYMYIKRADVIRPTLPSLPLPTASYAFCESKAMDRSDWVDGGTGSDCYTTPPLLSFNTNTRQG